jgi:DNA mismatch repair protein MutS
VRASGSRLLTARPDWWFDAATAEAAVGRALGGRRLEGLGFELPADAAGIAAAGAVVAYLEQNEPAAIGRIDTLSAWRPGRRLEIDEASRRSLELVRSVATGRRAGALAGVLDRTKSPMGARLLGEWLSAPLVDVPAIDDRLDAVAALVADPILAARLAERLSGIGDIERLVGRVVTGRAGPRDLERIGRATAILPDVVALLGPCGGLLGDLRDGLDPCPDIAARIAATLRASTRPSTSWWSSPPAARPGSPATRRRRSSGRASHRSRSATTACSASSWRSAGRMRRRCLRTTSASRR